MFLFSLEIVNKMRHVSIPTFESTHSIKQPCEMYDIKFTGLSFQILSNLYLNVKNCSPTRKMLGGVRTVKIRIVSFSVYF